MKAIVESQKIQLYLPSLISLVFKHHIIALNFRAITSSNGYRCRLPFMIIYHIGYLCMFVSLPCCLAVNSCAVKNGGCEHKCVDVGNNHYKCQCRKNYQLRQDGKHCERKSSDKCPWQASICWHSLVKNNLHELLCLCKLWQERRSLIDKTLEIPSGFLLLRWKWQIQV